MQQILPGRGHALGVVAREQRTRRHALLHQRQFPAEVVDVLHTAVGAARTKGRHQVRRIACKDDPVVNETIQHPALEGIDAGPLQLELRLLAEHAAHALR